MSDRDALIGTVMAYLQAAEARDLQTASAALLPEVEIVFPGGVRHENLEAVVEAAGHRYQWVRKTFDTTDVDVETGVVVITGHLSGRNLHGVGFEGIRFIDRFVLQGDRILRQHVWNDLEESGVLAATEAAALPAEPRGPC